MEERSQRVLPLDECGFDSAILRTGDETHVWFLNQHHLVTDATSTSLLFDEVAALYKQDEATAPRWFDFERFREYEQHFLTTVTEKDVAYWQDRAELESSPPPLFGLREIPNSSRTVRVTRTLSTETTEQLRLPSRREEIRGFTPHQSMFTVFAGLLFAWQYRLSGQTSLALGSPVHNRVTPELRETLGSLIELFPLFRDVDGSASFKELFGETRVEVNGFLRNARPGMSFPRLHQSFNVVLNYITAAFGDFGTLPCQSRWIHCGHGDPAHVLRLQVHDFDEAGEIQLHFDLNVEHFDKARRDELIECFVHLLEAAIADPEQALDEVSLVSLEPQPHPVFPEDSIVDRFRDIASRYPDRGAVTAAGLSLTYAELDGLTDQLARVLVDHGAGKDQVVAISVGRNVNLAVGILGVLKAGAAYLPLSSGDSVQRREALLKQSEAIAFLHDDGSLPEITLPRISLANIPEPVESASVLPAPSPEDLAYVLFTSGSTGTPKPVAIEHRNVMSLVESLATEIYGGLNSAALRVALVAPVVFDASVQQIFAALLGGHTLFPVPESARTDGAELGRFLNNSRIDVCDGTPSHLRLLLSAGKASYPENVRLFVIGGEAMPANVAREFLQRANRPPVLMNVYGPAECCVDCLYHEVTQESLRPGEVVPIGKPFPGEQLLVLNAAGQVQPDGVSGEFVLAGRGVGRGYLGEPSLTEERFFEIEPGVRAYRTGDYGRRRPDGTVLFEGRQDGQVKVRGHRIELGEIENALRTFRVERDVYVSQKETPANQQTVVRCRQCLLTEQHPGVTFADGVCNVCRQYANERSSIEGYFQSQAELDELVGSRVDPNAEFDCMLLYSGGKDSSYVLYRLVEMGLRVLAYTFDNGYISAAAFENIRRQTDRLGVTSIIAKTDRMDEVFLESLNTEKTVCTGCFKALTSGSTREAHRRGIRMVFTGLSRGQIFDTKLSGLLAEGCRSTSEIESQLKLFRRTFHASQDRANRILGDDLHDVPLEEIEFIDFFRYDTTPTAEVREYLKQRDTYWAAPKDTGFCSSNCLMNDIGICVHSRESGYHNYEAPVSWDIRLGTVTREDGLKEVAPPTDFSRINGILKKIGYLDRAIQEAVVVRHEDEDGRAFLCAYYVAVQTLTSSELREHLEMSLPTYMVPTRFVRLDSLPLNRSGKVDRSALSPGTQRTEQEGAYVPPRSQTEETLAAIWADRLGLERVGVTDNFFELGGDSITAMQIAARASAEGIRIRTNQFFSSQTIAQLAARATTIAEPDLREDACGDVPPSPIQHWFFEQNLPEMGMWNQSVEVAIPGRHSHANVDRAVRRLYERHESLRTSYQETNGNWTATIREKGEALDTLIQDPDNNETFDLRAGSLLRYHVRHDSQDTVIQLVVHHLAVDAIAMGVLIDELRELLTSRIDRPPVRSASFLDWVSDDRDRTQTIAPGVLDYWQTAVSQIRDKLPGLPQQQLAESETKEVRTVLPVAQTGCTDNGCGTSSIHEVVLAALATSLREWTGQNTVSLELEGHGRESQGSCLDLTRTVGWFTSRFPLIISFDESTSLGEALKATRAALESVPDNGASYNLLRYLHKDATVRDSLKLPYAPTVLFNFLGRATDYSGVTLRDGLSLQRGGSNPRLQPLEIAAILQEGSLCMHWSYSPTVHSADSIEQLGRMFEKHLIAITEDQPGTQESGPFPNAELDGKGMEQLANALSKLS